jgi:hypothetical protein
MKIKINVSLAGIHEGKAFSFTAGEIVAVPDELAKDLLKAGHAESVKPARKPAVKRTAKRG